MNAEPFLQLDRVIHEKGITPDVVVPLSADETEVMKAYADRLLKQAKDGERLQ